MQTLALVVKWPDVPGSIERITKLGGVPVSGRPHYLPQRGALVAIVQKNGSVSRIFECAAIEGPKAVTLATGTKSFGYMLMAKKNTLRKPRVNEQHLGCRWYAPGQFRYFDPKTWRIVFVTDKRGDGDYDEAGAVSEHGTIPWVRFQGGIPGVPKDAPENALVNAYVAWMRLPERFEHHYLRQERLYTDLFDRRSWRLIEAKMRTDRITLRTAVGQLFDYQRCYPTRHPSLGVLLPQRPRKSDLEFLSACKVTAIWRTPSGRFNDSSDDCRWSSRIR